MLPSRQQRGVGSALVRSGLEHARRLGHGFVVVLGHPSYYPRFGFVRAGLHRIRPPFAAGAEAFMVLELRPGRLAGVEGVVAYPPEFAAL